MTRREFGQRGELREPPLTDKIIGAPGGSCLCPGHSGCKNKAKAGLFIRNDAGNKVAVCETCHAESLLSWEEVLTA